jgi:hypothetical protein
MWRGEVLAGKETYTKRREKLKEFVQYHWVPDARLLGGIFTMIAQPLSMEKFAEKKSWDTCNSVEFIPDMPGKRRMIWYLEAQQKAAEAHAGLKQHRETVIAPTSKERSPIRARAAPVFKMPDIYDLYGEDDMLIGRGSVQQLKLSLFLKGAVEKGDVWVMANWQPEFNGYEISSIC